MAVRILDWIADRLARLFMDAPDPGVFRPGTKTFKIGRLDRDKDCGCG